MSANNADEDSDSGVFIAVKSHLKRKNRSRGLNTSKRIKSDENSDSHVVDTSNGSTGILDKKFVKQCSIITDPPPGFINESTLTQNQSYFLDEQKLYEIPPHLRVNSFAFKPVNHPSIGLEEVAVSIESRLNTIEETEKARRAIMQGGTFKMSSGGFSKNKSMNGGINADDKALALFKKKNNS